MKGGPNPLKLTPIDQIVCSEILGSDDSWPQFRTECEDGRTLKVITVQRNSGKAAPGRPTVSADRVRARGIRNHAHHLPQSAAQPRRAAFASEQSLTAMATHPSVVRVTCVSNIYRTSVRCQRSG